MNIHKTFRRRPGRRLNVLCTFNLRPVSTGRAIDYLTTKDRITVNSVSFKLVSIENVSLVYLTDSYNIAKKCQRFLQFACCFCVYTMYVIPQLLLWRNCCEKDFFPETYLGPCKIFMIRFFAKVVNSHFQSSF